MHRCEPCQARSAGLGLFSSRVLRFDWFHLLLVKRQCPDTMVLAAAVQVIIIILAWPQNADKGSTRRQETCKDKADGCSAVCLDEFQP